MALLLIEGWDHFAAADLAKKGWGTSGALSTSYGRHGGQGCRVTTANVNDKNFGGTASTVIFGAAVNLAEATANTVIFDFLEGTATHLRVLWRSSDGKIEVFRGAGTTSLGTSTDSFLAASGWHYVEAKAVIADAGGSIEVKVDGVQWLNVTGADTRNANTGYCNGIRFGGASSGSGIYIDDIYVCDNSGSAPQNGFLGDVRVDTLYPGGAGSNSNFSSSGGGGSSYTNVDEAQVNTTDYNYSSTLNHIDTYAMGDLTALGSTIYGVQSVVAMAKDDAGSRSAAPVVKSGATTDVGSNLSLGTSYVFTGKIYPTDPDTAAAWTESGVNAVEVGAKVTV